MMLTPLHFLAFVLYSPSHVVHGTWCDPHGPAGRERLQGRCRMSSPANRDAGAVQPWNDPVQVNSPELAEPIVGVAVGAAEHERRREPPFAAMQLVKEAGLGRLRRRKSVERTIE
jgi:hypothetical protein